MSALKHTFLQTFQHYSEDEALGNELWAEVRDRYSEPHRYYHTLSHLENMLQLLTEVKAQVEHWDAMCFALYYHDIVYDPSAPDNEEQSAALSGLRLAYAKVPLAIIQQCKALIIATKSHQSDDSGDAGLFLDADLSVLGQPWDVYEAYAQHVRLEYRVYPDELFFPGRKKVLQHFLAMEQIYKTAYFSERFEDQARNNLEKELVGLCKR